MADLARVNISVAESGLSNAIDRWFSQLIEILKIGDPQKLALLSSVTTYELTPDSPMFNQWIFRSWVDRSIFISPADPGSPSYYARHSTAFEELLTRATAKVQAGISPAVQAQIDVIDQNIEVVQTKIEAERTRVRHAWEIEAAARGLTDPQSPEYTIARIGFHSSELAYTRLQTWRGQIARYNTQIIQLRDAQLSPEDRTLLQLYEFGNLQEYKMKRPKTALLEKKYALDEVNLADFDTYNIPSAFEDGADILPSIKLENFLSLNGPQTITIEKNSTFSHTHESSWKGNVGGSFSFCDWNVEASGKSRFEQTIKRIGKLEIGCDNMAEIFAVRGPWFSMSGLTHPASEAALKADPKGLGVPLSYLVHSAIIVRGLRLTIHFDNSDDWDSFTQHSASGGASFFGIPIGSGGGGGGSTTEKGRDRATATITYGDDANLCRIVGFRLQPVLNIGGPAPASMVKPWLSDSIDSFVQKIISEPTKMVDFNNPS